MACAHWGFLPHRWPSWFSPRLVDLPGETFGPFPQSLRVTEAGDVTIVATHGHTKGHVSVVLDEGPRTVFFAGDTSYTQALMVDAVIDGVAPDEWVAYEFAKTRRFYATRMNMADRTEIEFFNGPHTINGQATFEFLRRHLRWKQ